MRPTGSRSARMRAGAIGERGSIAITTSDTTEPRGLVDRSEPQQGWRYWGGLKHDVVYRISEWHTRYCGFLGEMAVRLGALASSLLVETLHAPGLSTASDNSRAPYTLP